MTLISANKNPSFEGRIINDKRYGFHLIGCDRERGCTLRVNGVLIKGLKQNSLTDLDGKYKIRVNSYTTDTCGDKRWCNVYYDSYDYIDIKIEEIP